MRRSKNNHTQLLYRIYLSSPGVGIFSPVSSEAALHYFPKYIAHQSDCGIGSPNNFIHHGTYDGEDYHTGRVSYML